MKIYKSTGPRLGQWGSSNIISSKEFMAKPKAYKFVANKSSKRQSKSFERSFERSVKNAPKQFPLSKTFHHFSNIDAKQCSELKPLLKPH